MQNPKLLYIDFKLPYLISDINYPAGGSAVEWISWIDGFRRTGVRIGVLTWKGAVSHINRSIDFDLIESYELNKGIPIIKFFYYRIRKVLQAVKKYNPDIIIQEGSGGLTGISAYVAKQLGKKFIYRVASDKDADERIKLKLNHRELLLYKYGLNNASYILCQNQYQYGRFKAIYPHKKISIIHNPFQQYSSYDSSSIQRESFVAWIGNFRYEKNMKALFEIASALPDVEFRIAGSPMRKLDQGTQEVINKLSLLQNVQFVGYIKRSEILQFLSKARVLLNTSLWEGFSNTFLEAWTVGTPIISTSRVNPDNLICRHHLGYIADDDSGVPELIQKIISLDEAEFSALSEHCIKYVKTYHDPLILANKFLQGLLN